MTIQPYHRRLRLVPANTKEGRMIAQDIKHQQRANPKPAKPKVTRWHAI